ncbi:hypothetical protein PC9H_007050 [Pleurotus ostreatus]|uniref:Uncharacterized protein n=1 Tax=Pleurotus ostreatus TaxID=5322 RepID=A0A8H7DRC2_PLEOS|nr:uncharacterized protein PC9H_007050 [Pleurotus ostreatus]KAF7427834.1 hypothetical protein PC9H_007050 [Pleurotus ostreatus]KAJ8695829.1 hypothetical protein PTI98_005750 [Pleurotus ostreatus]
MAAGDSPVHTTIDIASIPDPNSPQNDPPPPYPSPRSTRRSRNAGRGARTAHSQIASSDSQHSELDAALITPSSQQFPTGDNDHEASESTPFLSPASPSGRRASRQRAFSHTSVLSTASAAPSLAHTLLSLFQPEGDDDSSSDLLADVDTSEGRILLMSEEAPSRRAPLLSTEGLKRYFRPVVKQKYYWSLLHLAVLNFPYALLAWVYLFVFTLTGTTLLMALPLGVALCFLDLLGARMFARGELAIQTRFHAPFAFPPPYPPRPIFTRYREATLEEIEAGTTEGTRVKETSFYKNAYAMFRDSTSYQALFYFLVIKPVITIVLMLVFLVLTPISIALIIPAPFILRAARRLGVWQANIAVEGLYMSVR